MTAAPPATSGAAAPLRPTIRPEIGATTNITPAIGSVYRPACERREAADVLEVERVEEQEPAQRRERADRDRAGPGERHAAEEAHLEQRLAAAQLVGDERREAAPSETANRTDRLRPTVQPACGPSMIA